MCSTVTQVLTELSWTCQGHISPPKQEWKINCNLHEENKTICLLPWRFQHVLWISNTFFKRIICIWTGWLSQECKGKNPFIFWACLSLSLFYCSVGVSSPAGTAQPSKSVRPCQRYFNLKFSLRSWTELSLQSQCGSRRPREPALRTSSENARLLPVLIRQWTSYLAY